MGSLVAGVPMRVATGRCCRGWSRLLCLGSGCMFCMFWWMLIPV